MVHYQIYYIALPMCESACQIWKGQKTAHCISGVTFCMLCPSGGPVVTEIVNWTLFFKIKWYGQKLDSWVMQYA